MRRARSLMSHCIPGGEGKSRGQVKSAFVPTCLSLIFLEDGSLLLHVLCIHVFFLPSGFLLHEAVCAAGRRRASIRHQPIVQASTHRSPVPFQQQQ